MFKSFRSKLLFWFLVLVSSNLAVVCLTTNYLNERERVLKTSQLIDDGLGNLAGKKIKKAGEIFTLG